MPDKNKESQKKLEQWQKLLKNGEVLCAATSRAQAEEMRTLIKLGFDAERDPYGKQWAPKQRPDGRKVLSGPTGRLRGGWRVRKADKGGFTVVPSVDYATPHQAPRRNRSGRLKRPRRMMVPSGERGVPREWSRHLKDVALSTTSGYYSSKPPKRHGKINNWPAVRREIDRAKREVKRA